MQSINALSLTPDVHVWLANSRCPSILHIFDRACNLINERRDVLSIVTPRIGNGPFSLMVEDNVLLSEHLNVESRVSIRGNELILGELTIKTIGAELWSPHLNWETLYVHKQTILDQFISSPITNYQPLLPSSLISSLSSALAAADISSTQKMTSQLAGLGNGLTPSGDDFLLGAMYAARIIHPPEVAKVLAKAIANTAAPLTTSLSAAWLRAGARGEAGEVWHDFFKALVSVDSSAVQLQITRLLSIGHASGADALSGFVGTMISGMAVAAKNNPLISSL